MPGKKWGKDQAPHTHTTNGVERIEDPSVPPRIVTWQVKKPMQSLPLTPPLLVLAGKVSSTGFVTFVTMPKQTVGVRERTGL